MDLDEAREMLTPLAENVDVDGKWGADYEQAAAVILDRLDEIEHRADQVRGGFLDDHLKWTPVEVVNFLLGETTAVEEVQRSSTQSPP